MARRNKKSFSFLKDRKGKSHEKKTRHKWKKDDRDDRDDDKKWRGREKQRERDDDKDDKRWRGRKDDDDRDDKKWKDWREDREDDRDDDAPEFFQKDLISGNEESLDYIEQQGPVLIDSAIALKHVHFHKNKSSIKVAIDNYTKGEDFLHFEDTKKIQGSFDEESGVLTLMGKGGRKHLHLALRSITYENTSDAPPEAQSITYTLSEDMWHPACWKKNPSMYSFTKQIAFTAINDAPVLEGAQEPWVYVENEGQALLLKEPIELFDVDEENLEGAEVRITEGYQAGEDFLHFENTAKIEGHFENGLLRLSGSASAEEYRQALQSITYENTSENPHTEPRTITLQATDGELQTEVLSMSLSVENVNDAPVLEGPQEPWVYVENEGQALLLKEPIELSDIDEENLEGAEVLIAENYQAGEDFLHFENTAKIEGHFEDGLLRLSGSASAEEYRQALQSITYENTSENPHTEPRTITLQATDGELQTEVLSMSLSVENVNDAPVLFEESEHPAQYVQNEAAIQLGSFQIEDLDDTHFASATVSIGENYHPGEDLLSFEGDLGLFRANFDPMDASLKIEAISGAETKEAFKAALEGVRYQNLVDNPSDETRILHFSMNDSETDSQIVTRELHIVPDITMPGDVASESIDAIANGVDLLIEGKELEYGGQVIESTARTVIGDVEEFLEIAQGGSTATTVNTLVIMGNDIINGPGILMGDSETVVLKVNGGPATYAGDDASAAIIEPNYFFGHDQLHGNFSNNIQYGDIKSLSIISTGGDAVESSRSEAIFQEGVIALGNDVLNTGAGNDILIGDLETLSLQTYQGTGPGTSTAQIVNTDFIFGSDTLNGGDGDDILYGDFVDLQQSSFTEDNHLVYGEDLLVAGKGNDIMWGDSPNMVGDGAADIFEFGLSDQEGLIDIGDNVIKDFKGFDELRFSKIPDLNLDGLTNLDDLSLLLHYGDDGQGNLRIRIDDNIDPLDGDFGSITLEGFEALNVTSFEDLSDLGLINQSPFVSGEQESLYYQENAPAISIFDPGLELQDLDDTNLQWANLKIAENFSAGEDLLEFTETANIAAAFDAENGILSLRGDASLGEYETLLESVTYQNTSEDPRANDRIFQLDLGEDLTFSSQSNLSDLGPEDALSITYPYNEFTHWQADGIGDVNNDGIDDMVLSVNTYNETFGESAKTYVLFGSEQMADFDLANLDGTNGFELVGSYYMRSFGYSVSAAGDFNGDGIDDFAVGDPNGGPCSLSVVFGGDHFQGERVHLTNLPDTAYFIERHDYHEYGSDVQSIGDFNNDGFDDLAILEPSEFRQRIYIQYGGSEGWEDSYGVIEYDDEFQESPNAKIAIKGGADINGDGYDDLVIGAGDVGDNGQTYVVYGRDSLRDGYTNPIVDLTEVTDLQLEGTRSGEWSGNSVDIGDVDMDGFADLLVGSLATGKAYLIFGDADLHGTKSLADADVVFHLDSIGQESFAERELITEVIGDVNADGYSDLAIGYKEHTLGNENEIGRVFVYYGKEQGDFSSFVALDALESDLANGFVIDGDKDYDRIGNFISQLGDLNNDGADDFFVGIDDSFFRQDPLQEQAYVVFGKESKALADPFEWQMKVEAINDAPSLLGEAEIKAVYAKSASSVQILEDLFFLEDLDDQYLESAKVSIVENLEEDLLIFEDTEEISASYDVASGELTLSGHATLSQYRQALRSVSYQNTSEQPNTLDRQITFSVHDGEAQSEIMQATLRVMDQESVFGDQESLQILDTDQALVLGDQVLQAADKALLVGDLANLDLQAKAIMGNASTIQMSNLSLGDDHLSDAQILIGDVQFMEISATAAATSSIIDESNAEVSSTLTVFGKDLLEAASQDSELYGDSKLIMLKAEGWDAIFLAESEASILDQQFVFGADLLYGAEGNDILYGDLQTLQLWTVQGSGLGDAEAEILNTQLQFAGDLLVGGAGDDILYGDFYSLKEGGQQISNTMLEMGEDTLVAGAGNDILWGDSPEMSAGAADRFEFALSEAGFLLDIGQNVIKDFRVSDGDEIIFKDIADLNGDGQKTAEDLDQLFTFTGTEHLQMIMDDNADPLDGNLGAITFEGISAEGVESFQDLADLGMVSTKPFLTGFQAPSTYVENAEPLFIIDPSSTLEDFDNTHFEGAIVRISEGFVAQEDQLSFTQTANIAASYDAQTGVLNLSGHATVDEYEELLQSLAYQNLSEAPTQESRRFSISIMEEPSFPNPSTANDLDGENGFLIRGENAQDSLGYSISSAGDINNDGFDDFVVSAPDFQSNGRAYVLFGTENPQAPLFDLANLDGTNGFAIQSADSRGLGLSLSSAGDFNNDGFDDLIVSSNATEVYMIYGKESFTATVEAAQADLTILGHFFQGSVSTAGDFNGDGIDDIIIGSPYDGASGHSYLFYGDETRQGSLDLADADLILNGRTQGFCGEIVSGGHDFNNDGLDDVMIAGRSYVDLVLGQEGLAGEYSLNAGQDYYPEGSISIIPYQAPHENITSLSFVGDVDADGFADALISNSNNSFLVFGKDDLDPIAELLRDSEVQFYAADKASAAGDVNNDGFADFLLARPSTNVDGQQYAGEAFLYLGKTKEQFSMYEDLSDLKTDMTKGLAFEGLAEEDFFGSSLNTIGDFNNDGFADFVIGAKDAGVSDNGDVSIVFGRRFAPEPILDKEIQIQSVADLPQISGQQSAKVFTEHDAPLLLLDQPISITDLDSQTLASARVEIYQNFVSGKDTLSFEETANITGHFDAAAGILHLQGEASLAEYESVLQNVMYENASDDPIQGERGIRLIAFDGLVDSQPLNIELEVIAINDAPTLEFLPSAPATLDLAELDGVTGFAIEATDPLHKFASDISSAGDINNDGFDDLLLGAYGAQEAYLLFGDKGPFEPINTSQIDAKDGFVMQSSDADRLGYSLSGVGDINSDGFEDFAVADFSGQTYLVFGQEENHLEDLSLLDGTNGFKFVQSGRYLDLSKAGDVNNDGFDDLIIGDWQNSQACVIFGKNTPYEAEWSTSDLDGSNGFVIQARWSNIDTAKSVSDAGDVNNDGFADLLLTIPDDDATFVLFGRESFDASLSFDHKSYVSPDGFVVRGDSYYGDVSASLSSLGDISGDGIDDFIVGSEHGMTSAVIYGKESTVNRYAVDIDNLSAEEGFLIDIAARSVSGPGDLNGDGIHDLLIGDQASSYVIYGRDIQENPFGSFFSLQDLDGSNGYSIHGGISSYHKVSSAGDVNNDGLDDFIIAVNPVDAFSDWGSSYLVLGRTMPTYYIENDLDHKILQMDQFIEDLDNTNLESATVSITENFVSGQDILKFLATENIEGSFDPLTGVLHLSGTASVEEYERALKSVAYENTSDDPNTATRSICFVVNDGLEESNEMIQQVYLEAVNDATELMMPKTEFTYLEGQGAFALFEQAILEDVDNTHLDSMRIQITDNFIASQDMLSFTNTASITGSYNSSQGLLTLSGRASLEEYQEALRLVQYQNTSTSPASDPKTISLSVNDGTENFALPEISLDVLDLKWNQAQFNLSSFNTSYGFTIRGIDPSDGSGVNVAAAGDVNGDGFDDLMLGANYADSNGVTSNGEAYMIFGQADGFSSKMYLSNLNEHKFYDFTPHAEWWRVQNITNVKNNTLGPVGDWTHHSSGGVPGGTISAEEVGGTITYFKAPSSLLGDLSRFMGGTFSFDLKNVNIDGGGELTLRDALIIKGSSGTISISAPHAPGTAKFSHYEFTLDSSANWRNTYGGGSKASETQIANVLRNVTHIYIKGEYINYDDKAYLDNVQIRSGADADDGFVIAADSMDKYVGKYLDGIGDINGDGYDDFILGSYAYANGGNYAGKNYVVFGREEPFSSYFELSDLVPTVSSTFDSNREGWTAVAIDAAYRSSDLSIDGSQGYSHATSGGVSGGYFIANDEMSGPTTFFKAPAKYLGNQSEFSGGTLSYDIRPQGANPPDLGNHAVIIQGRNGRTMTINAPSLPTGNQFNYHEFSLSTESNWRAGNANAAKASQSYIDSILANVKGFYIHSEYIPGADKGYLDNVIMRKGGIAEDGFIIEGMKASDNARMVAKAGDVNGDGYDDIFIAAPGADTAGTSSGEGYLIFGSPTFSHAMDLDSLNGTNGFTIRAESASDVIGYSLTTAGDFNNDGYDDLLIRAKTATAGTVYLMFGQENFQSTLRLANLDGQNGFQIDGLVSGDSLGIGLAGGGDFNGDGFEDIMMGSPYSDNPLQNIGEAYMLFGTDEAFNPNFSLSTLDGSNGFSIKGLSADDRMGYSLSFIGDFNGDGLDDALVSAYLADPSSGSNAGEAYVIFGTMSPLGAHFDLANLDGELGFKINGVNADDRAGYNVSAAGDVNGDGFDDLIIGAYAAEYNADNSTGESYVLFGGLSTLSDRSVYMGGDEADHLIGGEAADVMIAGQGDDTLQGLGGADSLRGGAGNDLLEIADADFLKIDGGSGEDTLKLAGENLNLDFTAIANHKIEDIEHIDLSANAHQIKLSLQDVFDMSSTTNELFVHGGADDLLQLQDLQSFQQEGLYDGFMLYENGAAALFIQEGINVVGI